MHSRVGPIPVINHSHAQHEDESTYRTEAARRTTPEASIVSKLGTRELEAPVSPAQLKGCLANNPLNACWTGECDSWKG